MPRLDYPFFPHPLEVFEFHDSVRTCYQFQPRDSRDRFSFSPPSSSRSSLLLHIRIIASPILRIGRGIRENTVIRSREHRRHFVAREKSSLDLKLDACARSREIFMGQGRPRSRFVDRRIRLRRLPAFIVAKKLLFIRSVNRDGYLLRRKK